MLRSVMPMISAACIHVISPPIARVMTSLIFIARSKARIGYNGIHSQPSMWTRTYSDPVPRPDISFATSTGQIMCYRHKFPILLVLPAFCGKHPRQNGTSTQTRRSSMEWKDLEKMTVLKLREEALKFPEIEGVHGKNKEQLMDELAKSLGI